jgi:hypothetical protein
MVTEHKAVTKQSGTGWSYKNRIRSSSILPEPHKNLRPTPDTMSELLNIFGRGRCLFTGHLTMGL